MLKRYESCWVLILFRYANYQIELVYAPAGYTINPHTHINQDIKLTVLFGHNVRFYRQRPGEEVQTILSRFRNMFKTYNIYAGDIHWFQVSRWPLVFINFEKWRVRPSSASIDLQLVKQSTKETIYGGKT